MCERQYTSDAIAELQKIGSSSNSTVYIYVLKEEGNEEIRYVGQSIAPRGRLAGHLACLGTAETHARAQWIREAVSQGKQIHLEVIEECHVLKGAERELHWFNYYKNNGHRLTNQRKPGDTYAAANAKGRTWEAYCKRRDAQKVESHSPGK